MEKQTLSPAKQSLSPELLALALPNEDLRKLVLLLIKEDLRSSKLVLGLSALGLEAGRYHTELSTVIFSLLGLDAGDDHLQGIYFECIDKASEIDDVEDGKRMEGMAEEVLSKLISI